jgi:hypothetical protein
MPELMATFRVLVVPEALPSRECDFEVLTVEAPFPIRVVADPHSLAAAPGSVTVNSQQRSGKELWRTFG